MRVLELRVDVNKNHDILPVTLSDLSSSASAYALYDSTSSSVLPRNPSKSQGFLKELAVIMKDASGHLNLSEQFEKLFTTGVIDTGAKNYTLILLANAGFTDSRVVYLWLKGEQQLAGASFELYRELGEVMLESAEDFEEFFRSHKPTTTLEYSREPSIGKK